MSCCDLARAQYEEEEMSPLLVFAHRWPYLIVLAGCLIALLGFGPRASFGLFLNPMTEANSYGRDTFALAIAVQNLLWGIGQPIAGAFADKFGSFRVLIVGAVLYGLGLYGTAVLTTPVGLNLTAGALIGFGLAGCSFNLVLGAFAKLLPVHMRPLAFGLGTAAGSLGQFIYAPLGVLMIADMGWQNTLITWAFTFFAVLPLAYLLSTPAQDKPSVQGGLKNDGLVYTLKRAMVHPSYLLLIAGFFVCGFHIAFITVHLPAYILDVKLSATTGGMVLAAIGLFNIVGSIGAGWLSGFISKKYLLAFIYGARAVVILLFILLPASPFTAIAFGASIGFLWLSTVAPTSSLVGVMFGGKYLSTLYGLVFLSHQVGAFLGVWLGGAVYAQTGSYLPVWWIGIGLGVFAALVHLPIKESAAPELAAAKI